MKKKIFLTLLVLFIAIQFIQSEKNEGPVATNQDITHYVEVPVNIQHILKASCYDCHSNQTNYPWYAQVNPVGWWLNHHIEEGKAEINFSDLTGYDKMKLDHKLEEIVEEVQQGHMPLPAYLWLHTDAKMNQQQVTQLVTWVNKERQKLNIVE
ncbi:heme-binding protein [Adhaeribacter aerolatus]|uniref:Heme-binding protein n=1 Tax=Adhaeribacter aerolatus TaxID=670289 RepID=A0A512B3V1_9BACT|nr:heme-binding domain-containing protein [Adhaeribacter aerolatus]GEO06643.1 heme-binding protein [Adhaeribacter aerolatus]